MYHGDVWRDARHMQHRAHRLAHVVDALLEDVLRAHHALSAHRAGVVAPQRVPDGTQADGVAPDHGAPALQTGVEEDALEDVADNVGRQVCRQPAPSGMMNGHEILVKVLEDGERRHAHRAEQTVVDRRRLAVVPDVQRTDVRAERPRNDGDDPIALVVRQQRAHRGARRVVVEDEVIGAEQPRQLHELDDVHLVDVSEERWHANGEVVAVSSP